MKKDLRKQIATYTGLASSIIALHNHADAQIIYTDPPDINLAPGDTANVDLNNDGLWDYHFSVSDNSPGPEGVVKVTLANDALHKGHSCCTCGFYVYSVSALDTLEVIYGPMDGSDDDNYLCNLDEWTCDSEWAGQIDKYMGVFLAGYYGWIRLTVSPQCNGLIIKDWAYNSQFGPILAGQTDLGTGVEINSTSSDKIKMYTNGAVLFIKDNFQEQNLLISVVNELGEIQFQTKTDNVSSSFNLDDLSSGIYFVIVKNRLEIFVEKIFMD